MAEQVITEEQKETETLKDGELLNGLRRIRIANIITVRIFLVLFFAVFAVALILPLRPTFSETEKRELAKFPKFKVSALFSGKYFEGIDNWYSDTFPARETLIKYNKSLKGFFGLSKTKISGELVEGDEIPETASEISDATSEAQVSDGTDAATSSVEAVPEVPPVTSQTLGAVLINGDTAYEYYNFNAEAASVYMNALNRAGALMNGKARVFDIIAPTSMGITAPDELVSQVNTSNQKEAIDYMYSGINGVYCVPIYNTLKNHKKEYIYFRTDHHWTALGAYYTYDKLMRCMGITPNSIDSYVKYEYPGFLGTLYNACKLPELAANPDTVYAYAPPQTNSISIFSGTWYNQSIISDMSAASPGNKYLTFIRGDNPLSCIVNPTLTDSSTCILIKESFGNSFVPFLVPHYQTIYIVDYRHIGKVDPRGLAALQAESGAQDIIFLNNISATRNKSLVAMLDSYVR